MAAAPVIIEDVWAQCENPECEKWRRLPPGTQLDETKKWFCSLNPDPKRNTCELPEEDYDQEAEINSQYFEAGAPIAPIVLTPKPEPVEDLRTNKGSRSKSGTAGVSRAASGSSKRGKGSSLQAAAVTWTQPQLLERQRWDSQVQLEHAGFQKLMQKGGSWEMAKGGSTITAPLPPWLWDGMASFSPEVAELACEGMDLSSAAAYFQAVLPRGKQAADTAANVSRLVMSAAAAVAGIGSTHVTRSAEAASSVWSQAAVTPVLLRQSVPTVFTPPVAPATLPESRPASTAARTVYVTGPQETKGMSGPHVAAPPPQHVSQALPPPQQSETIGLRNFSGPGGGGDGKESQSQYMSPHAAATAFEAQLSLDTAAAAAAADIDVLN